MDAECGDGSLAALRDFKGVPNLGADDAKRGERRLETSARHPGLRRRQASPAPAAPRPARASADTLPPGANAIRRAATARCHAGRGRSR